MNPSARVLLYQFFNRHFLKLTLKKVNYPRSRFFSRRGDVFLALLLIWAVMMLPRKDLQKELVTIRKKNADPDIVLAEVMRILRSEQAKERDIRTRLSKPSEDESFSNSFDPYLLEYNNVFHLSQIKSLCIRYRLRFLPAFRYSQELPNEAILRIKDLEKRHQTVLQDFRIVGPAEFFRLENADDPMLFAPIGNDYYYLIHKWGRDIHPMRKFLMWPLRNLENVLIFSFITSFFMAFAIREVFFNTFRETSEFFIIFLYCFKAMVGLVFFYGISLGKNVSSAIWNSKFFNG